MSEQGQTQQYMGEKFELEELRKLHRELAYTIGWCAGESWQEALGRWASRPATASPASAEPLAQEMLSLLLSDIHVPCVHCGKERTIHGAISEPTVSRLRKQVAALASPASEGAARELAVVRVCKKHRVHFHHDCDICALLAAPASAANTEGRTQRDLLAPRTVYGEDHNVYELHTSSGAAHPAEQSPRRHTHESLHKEWIEAACETQDFYGWAMQKLLAEQPPHGEGRPRALAVPKEPPNAKYWRNEEFQQRVNEAVDAAQEPSDEQT